MKIFNTFSEYQNEAKINDIICFDGTGIISGIKNINSKYDTYKIIEIRSSGQIILRTYKGRTNLILGINYYSQKVAILEKNEFNNLQS